MFLTHRRGIGDFGSLLIYRAQHESVVKQIVRIRRALTEKIGEALELGREVNRSRHFDQLAAAGDPDHINPHAVVSRSFVLSLAPMNWVAAMWPRVGHDQTRTGKQTMKFTAP
jgi:hypothetical protein